MEIIKQVILDFDIVGFHNYPNAPIEVEFLKNNHRHNFRIRVGYNVKDSDREKEIFIQEGFLQDYLFETYGAPCQFENMSCEMIAEDLLEFIVDDGGVWVEVLEDGRGGAKVEVKGFVNL